MPNIKSAAKRVKTSEEDRLRNQAVRRTVNTARKAVLDAITSGDKEKSKKTFSQLCSALDKAVKKGMIMANTANRQKSRISARLAKIAAPSA